MKYELGQTIYYMLDNKLHSAKVLARKCVENAHDDWACTKEQRSSFTPWGPSGVVYKTCHAEVIEDDVYESKEQMMKAICFGD
jgi:hypothetical protein